MSSPRIFLTRAGQTPSALDASSSPTGLNSTALPTRNALDIPPPSPHVSDHCAPPNAYEAATTATGDQDNPSALRCLSEACSSTDCRRARSSSRSTNKAWVQAVNTSSASSFKRRPQSTIWTVPSNTTGFPSSG